MNFENEITNWLTASERHPLFIQPKVAAEATNWLKLFAQKDIFKECLKDIDVIVGAISKSLINISLIEIDAVCKLFTICILLARIAEIKASEIVAENCNVISSRVTMSELLLNFLLHKGHLAALFEKRIAAEMTDQRVAAQEPIKKCLQIIFLMANHLGLSNKSLCNLARSVC